MVFTDVSHVETKQFPKVFGVEGFEFCEVGFFDGPGFAPKEQDVDDGADIQQFTIVYRDAFAGEEFDTGCKAAFCFYNPVVNFEVVGHGRCEVASKVFEACAEGYKVVVSNREVAGFGAGGLLFPFWDMHCSSINAKETALTSSSTVLLVNSFLVGKLSPRRLRAILQCAPNLTHYI